jgi:23S rRNA (cytosine1962-C5)-methyltransferase
VRHVDRSGRSSKQRSGEGPQAHDRGRPRENERRRHDGTSRGFVASPGAAAAVADGHPWIWRDGLRGPFEAHAPGDVVEVFDTEGEFVARGLIDPEGALAFRAYVLDHKTPLDGALLHDRLARALAVRETLFADPGSTGATTAYRIAHGEGDRLPGITLDRYGPVGVLRPDGLVPWTFVEPHTKAIAEQLQRVGIETLVLRDTRKGVQEGSRIEVLHGPEAPERISILEHGMAMEVDLARGQKTGAFLDQRENRRRVRTWSKGRRVLNLFSYAGGFSLAAALGGATEVTSVDIAHEAHKTAQRSFVENGLVPREHPFVTADVFQFLENAHKRNERWDLIICDPPSFASSEKQKAAGLAAYRKLHRAAARLLSPNGWLCAASCSSHVSEADFLETLRVRAIGRDDLRLLETFGPPADHPTVPAFREGRYLKFALLA